MTQIFKNIKDFENVGCAICKRPIFGEGYDIMTNWRGNTRHIFTHFSCMLVAKRLEVLKNIGRNEEITPQNIIEILKEEYVESKTSQDPFFNENLYFKNGVLRYNKINIVDVMDYFKLIFHIKYKNVEF